MLGSKPRRTDRLVVGRNVTLTLRIGSPSYGGRNFRIPPSSADELNDTGPFFRNDYIINIKIIFLPDRSHVTDSYKGENRRTSCGEICLWYHLMTP
jgi:hypothetical protein